ncbi:energy-coupling factor ABC transporter ATP-binding protein [Neotabrizicola sp. VNH66]|uniref:energy-coupling factor ABC transporter ATP-binding protein n=1 Tax=Neotabrizicola sp. VNH66 TaxID=3400918 RepID=UPI003C10755B
MTAPVLEIAGAEAQRDGRRLWHGLSLTLRPGQRVVVGGANGAGKTTLLRALVGLHPLAAGEVRFHGAPCRTEAQFRPLRLRVGFLFQDPDDQLFSPTVAEDVAFGPLNQGLSRAEAQARAMRQLAVMGLAHLADRPVHRLSGGEKRLVGLAGLLVMQPEVLLLDEPTAGLDADAEARLMALLDDCPAAQLIISHDAGLAARLGAASLHLSPAGLAEGQPR